MLCCLVCSTLLTTFLLHLSLTCIYTNDNARQMFTPKAASDFQRKRLSCLGWVSNPLPWAGFGTRDIPCSRRVLYQLSYQGSLYVARRVKSKDVRQCKATEPDHQVNSNLHVVLVEMAGVLNPPMKPNSKLSVLHKG